MRISIISGAEIVSGKEIVALELGQGLRSLGHDITYITGIAGNGDFRSRLTAQGFPWQADHLGFISAMLTWKYIRKTTGQLLQVPGLWRRYGRFLKQQKPDHIIHSSWHHQLLLWPFLSPKRDWLWLHEVLPDKPQYRRVFGWLSNRLSGFVPVSAAVARSLTQLGVPAEKIHVIHNGMTDPAPIRQTALTNNSSARIGIVGQVAEWKGHHDLLEALSSVVRTHSNAEMHIFGSPREGYEQILKDQARNLGLASHLIWHGFVADRNQVYENLDICAVPVPVMATEALPTVAIEAAFFSLPVVASRRGGLPEIIEDSVTGFLVEPGNKEELAARLCDLLESVELRKKLGGAARDRAVVYFNQERFAEEFENLLSLKHTPS
jgi:glycosyltransferase involved in cell wall biosynthesis